jgi:hypothetical protein
VRLISYICQRGGAKLPTLPPPSPFPLHMCAGEREVKELRAAIEAAREIKCNMLEVLGRSKGELVGFLIVPFKDM